VRPPALRKLLAPPAEQAPPLPPAPAARLRPLAQVDPSLEVHCRDLITAAARALHASKMSVFDERSGNMCAGGPGGGGCLAGTGAGGEGGEGSRADVSVRRAQRQHVRGRHFGGGQGRGAAGRRPLVPPARALKRARRPGQESLTNPLPPAIPNPTFNPLPSYVTELGRVASHYYIRAPSIVTFNEKLHPHIGEADVLAMMALSSEFESMAVRWGWVGGGVGVRGGGGWGACSW
jgi:hypothetical protein